MKIFGTDGIRGLANEDLTPTMVTRLAEAASYVLRETNENPSKKSQKIKRALVARDTRLSGQYLGAAISAGLASAGLDVIDIGVLPTPGVAFLSKYLNIELSVMITASHNPFYDNGIKFFTSEGYKLPDEVEKKIEERLKMPFDKRPIKENIGHISYDNASAIDAYCRFLAKCVYDMCDSKTRPLKGLRVVIDPANGAASQIAPRVFQFLGADVITINANPDGVNINAKCGSTHPEQLQIMTKSTNADLGVAFDGDADRCLAVDHEGNLITGDQIMAIFAIFMKKQGKLSKNTLVATVMSNKGLDIAMEKESINLVKTKVGDRYVLEEMRKNGYNFGGEQSGHMISFDYSTTGDGILTALLLCSFLKSQNKTLKELASIVNVLPQVLINVENVDKAKANTDPIILEEVAKEEKMLGKNGRVLLRPSGTEPIVRVMVEAETKEHANEVAERLVQIVKNRISLK